MSKDANHKAIVSADEAGKGTLGSYSRGYGLSLVLSLVTFILVERHVNHQAYSHAFVMIVIFALAIIQLFIQLIYFLHLGKESKPRWNLMIMLLAAMVVIILVGGSLWIMYNLNTRMTPAQVTNYMNSQDGL